MRKNQVSTATLNRERQVQKLGGNHGTLDVPAGATGPKNAVPAWLVVVLGPPEQGVERIALALAIRVAATLGAQREHKRAVIGALIPQHPWFDALDGRGVDRK